MSPGSNRLTWDRSLDPRPGPFVSVPRQPSGAQLARTELLEYRIVVLRQVPAIAAAEVVPRPSVAGITVGPAVKGKPVDLVVLDVDPGWVTPKTQ